MQRILRLRTVPTAFTTLRRPMNHLQGHLPPPHILTFLQTSSSKAAPDVEDSDHPSSDEALNTEDVKPSEESPNGKLGVESGFKCHYPPPSKSKDATGGEGEDDSEAISWTGFLKKLDYRFFTFEGFYNFISKTKYKFQVRVFGAVVFSVSAVRYLWNLLDEVVDFLIKTISYLRKKFPGFWPKLFWAVQSIWVQLGSMMGALATWIQSFFT